LMSTTRYAVASVAAGVAVTLLTGLYNNTPADFVGASQYGFPFTWLGRLVVPAPNPSLDFNVVSLVYDFIFWIALAGIVMFLVGNYRRKGVQIAGTH
jgi:hypothetical protein